MEDFSVPQPARAPRRILGLVLALVFVVLFVLVSIYFTKVYHAESSDSYPTTFKIESGSSATKIASDLEDQNLIKNPTIFLIYSYLNHAGNKIQAGEYQLDRNMSIAEIVDVITHGRVLSSARNVTIIEGWTNAQIAASLVSRQIIPNNADWTNALSPTNYRFKFSDAALPFNYQGFLFPDTYTLDKQEGAKGLIQKMLTNFESKFTDQMLADAQAKSLRLSDTIIMASIIEKEVGRNKTALTQDDLALMQRERELVSSVFFNRLREGMPLESDATVNYITGKADRSVTIADTKIKSPYNTYQVKGLPPTPISNPGLGSIMAAIYPAKSDYLYFLNAPDGTAYFAKTLAEHNANKAKYLK